MQCRNLIIFLCRKIQKKSTGKNLFPTLYFQLSRFSLFFNFLFFFPRNTQQEPIYTENCFLSIVKIVKKERKREREKESHTQPLNMMMMMIYNSMCNKKIKKIIKTIRVFWLLSSIYCFWPVQKKNESEQCFHLLWTNVLCWAKEKHIFQFLFYKYQKNAISNLSFFLFSFYFKSSWKNMNEKVRSS